MNDSLEKEIRQLFCDAGPLERDQVVMLLLGLLERIQELEAQLMRMQGRELKLQMALNTPAQPAPVAEGMKLVPLTPEQRKNLWVSAAIELPSQENCYYRGLVDAEAYHGITAAPEKGGAA